MSKLNRLWEKFNKVTKELEAAKGTKLFKAKQHQLMDIYDKIQKREEQLSMWSPKKPKKKKVIS